MANRKSLVGQQTFLTQFQSMLEGIRLGILEKSSPQSPRSFLILGEGGTGKTVFANTLKKEVEDHAGNCIYINGLEYKDPYNVYKFYGNTGSKSSGSICDQVALQANSVLIVDGVEHACDYFLEILERVLLDGKIKTANGDNVDFSNTFVIFLSSIKGKSNSSSIGFNTHGIVPETIDLKGTNIHKISQASEFILHFENLKPEHIRRLSYNRLSKIKKNLSLMGKDLVFDYKFLQKLGEDFSKTENLGGRYVHGIFSNRIDKYVIEQSKKNVKEINLEGVVI